jgi:hypothetical protein
MMDALILEALIWIIGLDFCEAVAERLEIAYW